MHAIQPRTNPVEHTDLTGAEPLPWEEAHAAPEDQAVGVELELIELVARRKSIPTDDVEALALDQEIEETLARLGSITLQQIAG